MMTPETALNQMADNFEAYAADEEALVRRGYSVEGGKAGSKARIRTWRDAAQELRTVAGILANGGSYA